MKQLPGAVLRRSRSAFQLLPFHLLALTTSLFPLTSCGTLPPLRGKIDVGHESFAIFVGGNGQNGDLYAVRADGGPAIPITFTAVAELRPSLSPAGTEVAFLRGRSLRDSTPSTLWVLNLLNGAERELHLPKGVEAPQSVGWSQDGGSVIVAAAGSFYRIAAPPADSDAQEVPPPERAAAESTLAVLVGDPVFARIQPCKRPQDLCVQPRRGKIGILAQAAREPLRWGGDSVAFFVGDLLQIRPLARGRPRILNWSDVPAAPRQMTFFQASAQPSSPSDQM